jgi:hypothetical protein
MDIERGFAGGSRRKLMGMIPFVAVLDIWLYFGVYMKALVATISHVIVIKHRIILSILAKSSSSIFLFNQFPGCFPIPNATVS